MQTIQINATSETVMITEKSQLITAGNVETIKCTFDLSEDFDDLIVRAVFNGKYRQVIDGECYAPPLDEGKYTVGVYGYELNNGEYSLVLSPKPAELVVKKGSFNENDVEGDNPTPTELEAHLALVNELIDEGKLKGDKGDKGDAGADGFSPSASVTQTASGATVNVTDKTGTTSANLTNGFSPIVSVERVTDGVRITILDKDGTHTAVVNDGTAGTMDYTELENLPREPYIPEAETVDYFDLADGKVYDAMGNFTLARYDGQTVVTSINIHAGDMFSVSEYNASDGYSTIAVFCNKGVYSFRSNMSDWAGGATVNGNDMVNAFAVKILPVEGVIASESTTYECDVTELADGVYIAGQTTTLTGWVSGTISVSKNTQITKTAGVLIVGNYIYGQYDLSTETKLNLLSSDLVQTVGQNTDKVMSQNAVTSALANKIDKPLFFTNVAVATSDWADNATTPDTGFEDYDYKAVITCQGVTADMYANIIYYDAQNKSGNYSFTGATGTNSITVYSNDNSAITIPTIIVGTPSIVNVTQGESLHHYSTTEQIVGTWFDGKPIYEKTIHYTGTQSASGTLTLNDIPENIDVKTFSGVLQYTDDGVLNPTGIGSQYVTYPFNDFRTIRWTTLAAGTMVIDLTLRYTKTTDTEVVV